MQRGKAAWPNHGGQTPGRKMRGSLGSADLPGDQGGQGIQSEGDSGAAGKCMLDRAQSTGQSTASNHARLSVLDVLGKLLAHGHGAVRHMIERVALLAHEVQQMLWRWQPAGVC